MDHQWYILNCITSKNKLYNKYTQIKNEQLKKQIYEEYKILRNSV